MQIASLHVHPVKGMRAVEIARAEVETRGLAGDRRWMMVDANGVFLTQRTHPHLATMSARLTEDGVTIAADGFGELAIRRPSGARRRDVVVWDAALSAAASDETASAFLSDLVGEEAHLVFMDEAALRHKASLWTPDKVAMSFADAFPVLVATTASLAALNLDIEKHGGVAVPMARFRPNIVVDCDEAWAEDKWTGLHIGDVALDLVKPCDRCIVTTTDQQSGRRRGKEPLAALARIHRSADPRINGVIFGVNAVPRALGEIAVGDEVRAVAG